MLAWYLLFYAGLIGATTGILLRLHMPIRAFIYTEGFIEHVVERTSASSTDGASLIRKIRLLVCLAILQALASIPIFVLFQA